MNVMFEVFLAPGATGDELLTAQTIAETKAQVHTVERARDMGLAVSDSGSGAERRVIVVPKIDERRIMNALEANPSVAKFQVGFADV